MDAPTVASLLLSCFLFPLLVQSAPTSLSSDPPPAFRESAERARMLVEKILDDIPSVHAAAITIQGLTLDPPVQMTHLQTMVASLGIPSAPVLKPLSERFTLDMCVTRMARGSQLYLRMLQVLSNRLSSVSRLQADIRDLLTQIAKMKEAAQLTGGGEDQSHGPDLSGLHSNYEVEVAAHLTLSQLQSFCHDLIRSLRAVATYRP
ncbi:colony stimulating factor 3 (granulocyte) b [Aulostomus maculatus]